jgi:hypothetical protein
VCYFDWAFVNIADAICSRTKVHRVDNIMCL